MFVLCVRKPTPGFHQQTHFKPVFHALLFTDTYISVKHIRKVGSLETLEDRVHEIGETHKVLKLT